MACMLSLCISAINVLRSLSFKDASWKKLKAAVDFDKKSKAVLAQVTFVDLKPIPLPLDLAPPTALLSGLLLSLVARGESDSIATGRLVHSLSGLLLSSALSLPCGESDSIATGQRELTAARGECLCVISIAAGL